MLTSVNEIQAKTILTKTALPGCDYVINPHIGPSKVIYHRYLPKKQTKAI